MCKHGSDCQLSVWVFLVILLVWSIPVQIVVSLLNYASTAHHSRDKYFPLYVEPLNVAGEVISRLPKERPLYVASLNVSGETIGRPPEEGPLCVSNATQQAQERAKERSVG